MTGSPGARPRAAGLKAWQKEPIVFDMFWFRKANVIVCRTELFRDNELFWFHQTWQRDSKDTVTLADVIVC